MEGLLAPFLWRCVRWFPCRGGGVGPLLRGPLLSLLWRWPSLSGDRGVGPLLVGRVASRFVGPLLVGIHTYPERWLSLSGVRRVALVLS
jgi:hypothetical protein